MNGQHKFVCSATETDIDIYICMYVCMCVCVCARSWPNDEFLVESHGKQGCSITADATRHARINTHTHLRAYTHAHTSTKYYPIWSACDQTMLPLINSMLLSSQRLIRFFFSGDQLIWNVKFIFYGSYILLIFIR